MRRWLRLITVLACVLALGGIQSHGFWHRHDASGHCDEDQTKSCQVCALVAQSMGDGLDAATIVVSHEVIVFAFAEVRPQVLGSRALAVVRSRGPPAMIA